MTTKTYYTHDNGGKPFKVDILKKDVTVSSRINLDTYKKFVTYKPKKIFIGKDCPHPNDNNQENKHHQNDGNSILLYINNNIYIFIGDHICVFKSFEEIIEYKSPMNGSDVAYPYAIDKGGYVYLFIEDAIMSMNDELEEYLANNNNAYNYYYNHYNITYDQKFEDIKEFYIGNHQYGLHYSPKSKEEYLRFLTFEHNKVGEYGISIVDFNNNKIQLTQKMYVNLIKRFGKFMGFQKLEKIMIYDRN